jgi:hypothetical protein
VSDKRGRDVWIPRLARCAARRRTRGIDAVVVELDGFRPLEVTSLANPETDVTVSTLRDLLTDAGERRRRHRGQRGRPRATR